jgi:hypothetical protein
MSHAKQSTESALRLVDVNKPWLHLLYHYELCKFSTVKGPLTICKLSQNVLHILLFMFSFYCLSV